MQNEQHALDALADLKRAISKLDQTFISHYLKTRLQDLVKQVEKEIDLRDQ